MNTNNNDLDPKTDKEQSPIMLWAAYIPGEGTQRNYLSGKDAQGRKAIRLWKSEESARAWLISQIDNGKLPIEVYARIELQQIEGKFALPEEADLPVPEQKPAPDFHAPDHLKPIMTLYPETGAPKPSEQLTQILWSRNHGRKRSRRNGK